MLQIVKKFFRKLINAYKSISKRLKIYKRDLLNKLRFGMSAPLYKERIWVDPRRIEQMIEREEVKRVSGFHRSRASGVVIDWDKIKNIKPITDEFRVQYCFEHWKEGKTWDELGVIDFMTKTKSYGDWPRSKIKARFHMLDQAFEETKETGRLKTRKELDPGNFRENGGILVHIGKGGQPYFGGNGFHRLCIAKVLELEKIPACVGLVDRSAIKYMDDLRKPD